MFYCSLTTDFLFHSRLNMVFHSWQFFASTQQDFLSEKVVYLSAFIRLGSIASKFCQPVNDVVVKFLQLMYSITATLITLMGGLAAS